MSMRQVLDTTLDALADPTIGMSAQVTTLISGGAPAVGTEFSFGKWALRGELQPATTHAVIVRPSRGADTTKVQETHQRDGVQELEAVFETFAADQEALQDAIAVVQTAFLMVLDHLIDYSRTHGGTIIEIIDPVSTSYGEFDGVSGATSAGFVGRFTITERSLQ